MLEGFGAAERFGDKILSWSGGKGRGVVLNDVRVVGVSRASSPQPVGGKKRQNDIFLAVFQKWARGCAAGLSGVFFKSLVGKYADFGRMAEKLKRAWETRTG